MVKKSDNDRGNMRPLSPHLQIYRPQITSILSILHRLTGIFVYFSTFIWIFFFWLLALEPKCLMACSCIFHHPFIRLAIICWSWACAYHLANGIRHLAWDAGWGFELKHTYRSGWLVVLISFLATIMIWIREFF